MTDKERLEDIKRKEAYLEGTNDLVMVIETDDYRWLIQQAQRVQELESDSYNAHLERLLDKREQQNKRYREAIEVAIHNMTASDNLGVKFALRILEQALEGEGNA